MKASRIASRVLLHLPFCQANIFSHFRTPVPTTESTRIAKTLASTVAPVLSKAYYSDPDQSYPYYTIYDDDVSIYKDDGKQPSPLKLFFFKFWTMTIERNFVFYCFQYLLFAFQGLCALDELQKLKNWEIPNEIFHYGL